MSKADIIYTDMLSHILENGSVIEDGRDILLRSFGIVNRYDLRKEFPLLTVGKVDLAQGVDEILWIYQKKTPYVTELLSKDSIYHTFSSIMNSIGKSLGYQIGKKFIVKEKKYRPREILERKEEFYDSNIVLDTENFIRNVENSTEEFDYKVNVRTVCDQMDMVLYYLRHDPYGNTMILNLFEHTDLIEMNLIPDIYSCTFVVTKDAFGNQVLNMTLNQRTLDAYNCTGHIIAQYAAFLMMLAKDVNMIPGEFIHMIAEAHIHKKDIPVVERLLMYNTQFSAPKVTLDAKESSFYRMTKESFSIINYKYDNFVFKNTLKEVEK